LAERITDPIEVPPGLWQRLDTVEALRARNIQKLFYLLRKYTGASQTRLAIACGLTQGKVSEIMAGARRVVALDVFERIADGLDMPSDARIALGLAPLISGTGSMPGIPARDGSRPPSALMLGPPDNDEAEDPMRRRTFTRLA
jgi:transcriptional regulator with XRE-family HTH domain